MLLLALLLLVSTVQQMDHERVDEDEIKKDQLHFKDQLSTVLTAVPWHEALQQKKRDPMRRLCGKSFVAQRDTKIPNSMVAMLAYNTARFIASSS